MGTTFEVASDAAATTWTDVTSLVDFANFRSGGEIGNGSAGTGFGFDFADDAAAYEFPARRAIRHKINGSVVARGRVAIKDLSRGMIPAGDARQYAVSFTDGNAHLQGIPVHGWVRPAETDVERMTALCADFLAGSRRASTNLATTYLSSDNPVDLEAKTYDATNPAGVVSELIRIAGKICFVTVDDEIFYDVEDSANYNAGLSVTDDGPDLATEFPPIWDGPAATQDGTELYTGLHMVYGNPPATVFATDATAASDFDFWEEVVNSEALTAEAAQAEVNSLLAVRKLEENRYRFTIQLAEADTDLVKYGQNISFRAAAAGVLTPITLRIQRLSWELQAPGIWLAHIEDAKLASRLARGSSLAVAPGRLPGFFQPAATCFADQFLRTVASGLGGGWTGSESAHIDVSVNGSAGVVFFDDPGTVPAFEGMTYTTNVPTQTGPYGAAAGFSFSIMPPGAHGGLVFYDAFGDFAVTCTIGNDGTGSVLLETPASSGIWLATEWKPGYHPISVRVTPGVGVFCYVPISGEETAAISVADATVAGGTSEVGVSVQLTNMIGDWTVLFQSLIFDGCAPYKGQQVPLESVATADGATTGFQTSAPYWPGSLRVLVDRIDWTNEVTETDPTTGAFTFDTAPFDTDQIDAYYVAG